MPALGPVVLQWMVWPQGARPGTLVSLHWKMCRECRGPRNALRVTDNWCCVWSGWQLHLLQGFLSGYCGVIPGERGTCPGVVGSTAMLVGFPLRRSVRALGFAGPVGSHGGGGGGGEQADSRIPGIHPQNVLTVTNTDTFLPGTSVCQHRPHHNAAEQGGRPPLVPRCFPSWQHVGFPRASCRLHPWS